MLSVELSTLQIFLRSTNICGQPILFEYRDRDKGFVHLTKYLVKSYLYHPEIVLLAWYISLFFWNQPVKMLLQVSFCQSRILPQTFLSSIFSLFGVFLSVSAFMFRAAVPMQKIYMCVDKRLIKYLQYQQRSIVWTKLNMYTFYLWIASRDLCLIFIDTWVI